MFRSTIKAIRQFTQRRAKRVGATLTVIAFGVTIAASAGTAFAASDGKTGAFANMKSTNQCIDVKDGKKADGTQIRLWPCNKAEAQKVTVEVNDKGTLSLHMMDSCIDVTNGNKADGTIVRLWGCNDAPAQEWLVTRTGMIINPNSNRCLGTKGAKLTDGAQMVIAKCTGNTATRWKHPSGIALTQAYAQIKFSAKKTICISADDDQVESAKCDNNDLNQKWFVTRQSDGNYRFMNDNKCLAADGSDASNQDCEDDDSQLWKQSSGKLINVSSKKCLTTDSKKAEADQSLVLSTCSKTTSSTSSTSSKNKANSQKFVLPTK